MEALNTNSCNNDDIEVERLVTLDLQKKQAWEKYLALLQQKRDEQIDIGDSCSLFLAAEVEELMENIHKRLKDLLSDELMLYGWNCAYSAEHDEHYYWHPNSSRVQWERPSPSCQFQMHVPIFQTQEDRRRLARTRSCEQHNVHCVAME